jgi:ABC-2 type transport system ATP-binding protein
MAEGLGKSYGGRPVLTDLNLAVPTGTVLALLGPNGAGKTTTVRILATLVRPDTGTATVAGHDLRTDPVGVRRAISLTGQHAAVDDMLTGRENLELMARLRHLGRRAARDRVAELLGEFDLTDARDRRVGTYSGGMKRRLDLAISMIVRPELVFLDEPTTGLDPRGRDQLWQTVRGIVADGVTVLLTTQYLAEADELADRIVMLDRGRIVAEGTAAELKAGVGAEIVRLHFADHASFRYALDHLPGARPAAHAQTVDVPTGGSASEVLALLDQLRRAGAAADTVTTVRPSLDDVFLSLTGRDPTDAGEPEDDSHRPAGTRADLTEAVR